jgi:hypothetical protein
MASLAGTLNAVTPVFCEYYGGAWFFKGTRAYFRQISRFSISLLEYTYIFLLNDFQQNY